MPRQVPGYSLFSPLFRTGLIAALYLPALGVSAEWTLVYSEDWSTGAGEFSVTASQLHGARAPQRSFIGHELADYIIWFDGHCGWAAEKDEIPETRMKLVTRLYVERSQRNALSVNVRSRRGSLIYKYSMGGGRHVDANCQPAGGGEDQPIRTDLDYALKTPYELYSVFEPGQGYRIGLRNLMTGEDRLPSRLWSLKSDSWPAKIDFDQEGGSGPAGLGRVEVWLDL